MESGLEKLEGDAFEQLKLAIWQGYAQFRSRKETKGYSLPFPLREFRMFSELIKSYGSLRNLVEALQADMKHYRFVLKPDGLGCLEVILRSEVVPPPIRGEGMTLQERDNWKSTANWGKIRVISTVSIGSNS